MNSQVVLPPTLRAQKMSNEELEQLSALPQWGRMQYASFKEWCNYWLAEAGKPKVLELGSCFQTGLVLVDLLEALSGKRLAGINKNAKVKIQCINNLFVAFKFIEHEGIVLANIQPEDIHGKNLKLILGLVWSLILHYQISFFADVVLYCSNCRNSGYGCDGSDPCHVCKQRNVPCGGIIRHRVAPREALLYNLNSMVRDRAYVSNFSTSFQDGIVFCALIAAQKPDLIDFTKIDPDNMVGNITFATNTLKQEWNIPRIFDAEEFVSQPPDEKAVMTYISLCLTAFAKKKDPKVGTLRRHKSPPMESTATPGDAEGHNLVENSPPPPVPRDKDTTPLPDDSEASLSTTPAPAPAVMEPPAALPEEKEPAVQVPPSEVVAPAASVVEPTKPIESTPAVNEVPTHEPASVYPCTNCISNSSERQCNHMEPCNVCSARDRLSTCGYSCMPCQHLGLVCDGKKPCKYCLGRGKAASCIRPTTKAPSYDNVPVFSIHNAQPPKATATKKLEDAERERRRLNELRLKKEMDTERQRMELEKKRLDERDKKEEERRKKEQREWERMRTAKNLPQTVPPPAREPEKVAAEPIKPAPQQQPLQHTQEPQPAEQVPEPQQQEAQPPHKTEALALPPLTEVLQPTEEVVQHTQEVAEPLYTTPQHVPQHQVHHEVSPAPAQLQETAPKVQASSPIKVTLSAQEDAGGYFAYPCVSCQQEGAAICDHMKPCERCAALEIKCSYACSRCIRRKAQCDGERPCTACIVDEKAASCVTPVGEELRPQVEKPLFEIQVPLQHSHPATTSTTTAPSNNNGQHLHHHHHITVSIEAQEGHVVMKAKQKKAPEPLPTQLPSRIESISCPVVPRLRMESGAGPSTGIGALGSARTKVGSACMQCIGSNRAKSCTQTYPCGHCLENEFECTYHCSNCIKAGTGAKCDGKHPCNGCIKNQKAESCLPPQIELKTIRTLPTYRNCCTLCRKLGLADVCDQKTPCQACIRHGLEFSCTYACGYCVRKGRGGLCNGKYPCAGCTLSGHSATCGPYVSSSIGNTKVSTPRMSELDDALRKAKEEAEKKEKTLRRRSGNWLMSMMTHKKDKTGEKKSKGKTPTLKKVKKGSKEAERLQELERQKEQEREKEFDKLREQARQKALERQKQIEQHKEMERQQKEQKEVEQQQQQPPKPHLDKFKKLGARPLMGMIPRVNSEERAAKLHQKQATPKDKSGLHAQPEDVDTKCCVCHQGIQELGFRVNERNYHKHHFCCAFCGVAMTDGRYCEKENELCCESCYTVNFETCHACQRQIEETYVVALASAWHSKCFRCANAGCHAALNGQYFVVEKLPYCAGCLKNMENAAEERQGH